MRLVVLVIQEIHHVKEVFNITQVISGLVKRSSDSVSVAVSGQSRAVSEDAVDLLINEFFIFINLFTIQGGIGLRMDSGQGRN